MTDNHTELCERLRQASVQCSDCGMYETSSDFDLAVSMIESQAARIQQQALECVSLFDQCSEHLGRIAELEKERDTLKVDAARYDFLRCRAELRECSMGLHWYIKTVDVPMGMPMIDATLANVIDAALQAEKETK